MRRGSGLTTQTKPHGPRFIAVEIALEVTEGLRPIVAVVRKHDAAAGRQIVSAASSVAANLAEGSRRRGGDRLQFFRIAAGSADETRAHLRIAIAWGWLRQSEAAQVLALLDRELGLLWGLTH